MIFRKSILLGFAMTLALSFFGLNQAFKTKALISMNPNPFGQVPDDVYDYLVKADTYAQTPAFARWLSPSSNPESRTVSVSEGTGSVSLRYSTAGAVGFVTPNYVLLTAHRVTKATSAQPGTIGPGLEGAQKDLNFNPTPNTPGTYRANFIDFTFSPDGGFISSGNYSITVEQKMVNWFSDGQFVCVRNDGVNQVTNAINWVNDCPSTPTTLSIYVEVTKPNKPAVISASADCNGMDITVSEEDGVQPHVVDVYFNAGEGQPGAVYGGSFSTDSSGRLLIPRSRFQFGPDFNNSKITAYLYTNDTVGDINNRVSNSVVNPSGNADCGGNVRNYDLGLTSSISINSSFDRVTAGFAIKNNGDGPSVRAPGSQGIPTNIRVYNEQTNATYFNYQHNDAVYYPPSWGGVWSGSGWTGWPGEEINSRAISQLGLGERVCIRVTVNPGAGITDGAPTDGLRDTKSCSDFRSAFPYLQIYQGDVIAGGKFEEDGENFCDSSVPGGAGGIRTFSRSTATRQIGSYVQYGAFAKSDIEDDVSAIDLTGFTSRGPTSGSDSFTFSNTTNPEGQFGVDNCMKNYYQVFDDGSSPVSGDFDLSSISGKVTVKKNGPVRVYRSGNSSLSGKGAVLLVDGDVTIDSDIDFRSGSGTLATDIDSIPYLIVVAKGDIFISPSVSKMDGVYVAQPDLPSNPNSGSIVTCHDSTPADDNDLYNTCKNQLRVTGSLIARKIEWKRTWGDLNDLAGSQNDRVENNYYIGNASESINISPEVYFGLPTSPRSYTKYDSLRSLPPVF